MSASTMEEELATHLTGRWANQLGSSLELEADDAGHLSGRYWSTVGASGGPHPLTGYFEQSAEPGCAVVGFVVGWRPAHSLTVWAGHYEAINDHITATWLLTGAPAHDDWGSTLVGHDVFRRLPGEATPDGPPEHRSPV